jgi:PadR family transcriptional regulator PadR
MPSTRGERVELLQGSLDLIVLRALTTMGPLHAYVLAARLEQVTEHLLTRNQGTLYPTLALVRLEQGGWIKGMWQRTDTNHGARHYATMPSAAPASAPLRFRSSAGAGSPALLSGY